MPTDDSPPADGGDAEGDAADVEPDVPRAPDLTDNEPGLLEELTGRTPEAPDYDAADFGPADGEVDADLAKQFWSLVLILNVALLGMALGLLLAGFERRFRLGGAMFAVGAAALVRAWYRYRAVRKD